VSIYCISL